MRIGIIGAGFSGRAVARLAMLHGHEVMLSNCENPAMQASAMLRCAVGTPAAAAGFGDIVLLAVPFRCVRDIAPGVLAGKIVVDAGDYGPECSRGFVAERFVGARVVKALNVILEKDIEKHARPAGSVDRRAIPIASDDERAKETIFEILDQLGFDVVDAGPLAEGWRFERGQAAFGGHLDRAGLARALGDAG
jgi:8-hydroxy-5-deazaflavin:NADPH oxidoreductase